MKHKKSKEELKRLRLLRSPEEKEKLKRTGRKSKRKGGRGERELVSTLKKLGVTSARRTAQLCGYAEGDPDVEAPVELPSFHIESKRCEQLNVFDAVDQAIRDSSKTGNIPLVAHKKNYTDWVVIMPIALWVKMALRVQQQILAEIDEALLLDENDADPTVRDC